MDSRKEVEVESRKPLDTTARAGVGDPAFAESTHDLVKRQTELMEVQANVGREAVRVSRASMRAAWTSATIAFLALGAAVVQACLGQAR